jgi:ATP-binding cassette subfamily C protein CydCD
MGESGLLARVPGARRLLILAVGCGLLSAVMVVVEALLLSAVVGAAFLGTGSTAAIPGLLIAMVIVVIARLPLGVAAARLGESAARRLTNRLRTDLTDGLLAAGPIAVGRERRGELASVMVGGLDAVADLVAVYLPARWLAITVPLLILAVVTLIDPPSTLVLLATGPLLVLLLAVIGGRARALTQRRFDETRWLGAFFLDVLQGIATLKMFGRSAEQVDTIQHLGRRYADASMEVLRTAFQTSLVLEWGASIAVALVAVEISLRLMGGSIGFERALAVLVITPAFFLPLRQLAGQYHVGAAGRAAAGRIAEILDGVPAGSRAPAVALGPRGSDAPAEVRLEGVRGGYRDRTTHALDGVDLGLEAGSFVALVGPTGAGKSTILAMLLRFLEPSRGRITVGGRPLASIDPAEWRAAVSWLPQHPQLVHGSIAENLRLARPDASDEEVRWAINDAGAASFVAGLPEGLETVVGPGGRGLSGGQVRRLALARALLADAPYLLLDEPTADLDPASVAAILPALGRLRGRRTVIVAAHDHRLMELTDTVVSLADGRVIAIGPAGETLDEPRRLDGPPGRTLSARADEPETQADVASPLSAALADSAPAPVRRANTFRRLVGLLRPQRRWIAVAAGLGLLTVVSNVALAAVSAYLISRAAIVTNIADVALAVTAVRVLAIARSGFRYAERLVTHRATFEALTEIRAWFYRSIEPLAPARLARHRGGDLLARIGADVDTLESFPARVLLPPLVAVGVVVFGALLLRGFDPAFAAVLVTGLLVAGLVVPLAIRGAARRTGDAAIGRRADVTAGAVDLVAALGDLVVLDRDRRHRAQLLAGGRDLDSLRIRGALLRAAGEGSAVLVAGLTGVAVLAIGVGLAAAGRLDGVYLALVTLAAVACFEAVGPVSQAVEALPRHERAAGRLFELVDAPPAVVDPARPAARAIAHDLEIAHLTFAYDGGSVALDDVSLSIPAGGRLAVIGPSGAGKSTLVNLLLRFWDYEVGEIRIDGRDLREYRMDDVRSWLGVVDQRVHLFNATVRDNLAVADADATDADMAAACRIAQLHEFVTGLPSGYSTRIGQDGLQLSGGQRQQLAVARMVLKGAPIVVLDEATSHLDEATERSLLDALEPFLARRTVLMIAHRPAVIDRVDRVVRLETGRVVGGPVGLLRAAEGRA